MITLYDLLKILDLDSELEVFNFDCDLLQDGINRSTMWEDDLLEQRVYKVIPGIVTMIFLEANYD